MSLAKAEPRKIDALFDFVLRELVRPNPRPPVPAEAVNTLGEVPDSNWFTNRHARRRLHANNCRRYWALITRLLLHSSSWR